MIIACEEAFGCQLLDIDAERMETVMDVVKYFQNGFGISQEDWRKSKNKFPAPRPRSILEEDDEAQQAEEVQPFLK